MDSRSSPGKIAAMAELQERKMRHDDVVHELEKNTKKMPSSRVSQDAVLFGRVGRTRPNTVKENKVFLSRTSHCMSCMRYYSAHEQHTEEGERHFYAQSIRAPNTKKDQASSLYLFFLTLSFPASQRTRTQQLLVKELHTHPHAHTHTRTTQTE